MIPDWLIGWILLEFAWYQFYGLLILLGSFAVATWSDVIYTAAQKEFVKFWYVCLVFFLLLDAWHLLSTSGWNLERLDWFWFAVKWLFVAVFALLSFGKRGKLFKLAEGDVVACAAVMSMMNFPTGLIFVILLVIVNVLLRPILRRAGDGEGYPFMPVVLTAALLIILIVFFDEIVVLSFDL